MPVPSLVFAFVLVTALAAAYHLIFARSLRQLAWLWLASLIGFALGQVVADVIPFALPRLGLIRPIEGALMSVLLMTVVKVLRL